MESSTDCSGEDVTGRGRTTYHNEQVSLHKPIVEIRRIIFHDTSSAPKGPLIFMAMKRVCRVRMSLRSARFELFCSASPSTRSACLWSTATRTALARMPAQLDFKAIAEEVDIVEVAHHLGLELTRDLARRGSCSCRATCRVRPCRCAPRPCSDRL